MHYEEIASVDHFVLNGAEVTLPEFLSDLQVGRPRRVYWPDQHPDFRLSPAPQWELPDGDASTVDIQ